MNPLESLNFTYTKDIPINNFIDVANSYVAIPSMIMLFISILLINLILGFIFVQKNRSRMLAYWFSTFVLSLVILLLLIFMPNTVQMLSNIIREFIK